MALAFSPNTILVLSVALLLPASARMFVGNLKPKFVLREQIVLKVKIPIRGHL